MTQIATGSLVTVGTTSNNSPLENCTIVTLRCQPLVPVRLDPQVLNLPSLLSSSNRKRHILLLWVKELSSIFKNNWHIIDRWFSSMDWETQVMVGHQRSEQLSHHTLRLSVLLREFILSSIFRREISSIPLIRVTYVSCYFHYLGTSVTQVSDSSSSLLLLFSRL